MKIPKWVCHQIPERCFSVRGKKLFLCSRCLMLYLGMIIGFIISLISNLAYFFNKKGMLVVMFILLIPMAIDGTTQLVKLRESNNTLRTITGLLAGLICGVGIHFIFIHL